jgi:hypothetical protein
MLPERPQAVSINGHAMRRTDLEAMDFDELWLLHEQLTKLLSEKITTEKLQLERRLAQLSRPLTVRDAHIQKFSQNTGIPPSRPKSGPGAGSSRDGSSPPYALDGSWKNL